MEFLLLPTVICRDTSDKMKVGAFLNDSEARAPTLHKRTPQNDLRAGCGHSAPRNGTPNALSKAVGHREEQRKERRRKQGNLVRLLDAALPNKFRGGACVNGAGDRALGMAGRSLHDVLEDAIEAVAELHPDQSLRLAKRKAETSTAPRARLGLKAVHDRTASFGLLMLSFLDAPGRDEQALMADVSKFVPLDSGLRDASKKRKLTNDMGRSRSSSETSTSPLSDASTTGSPTPLPTSSRPALPPLAQPSGHSALPRLPPIRVISDDVPRLPVPLQQQQQQGDIPASKLLEQLLCVQLLHSQDCRNQQHSLWQQHSRLVSSINLAAALPYKGLALGF